MQEADDNVFHNLAKMFYTLSISYRVMIEPYHRSFDNIRECSLLFGDFSTVLCFNYSQKRALSDSINKTHSNAQMWYLKNQAYEWIILRNHSCIFFLAIL